VLTTRLAHLVSNELLKHSRDVLRAVARLHQSPQRACLPVCPWRKSTSTNLSTESLCLKGLDDRRASYKSRLRLGGAIGLSLPSLLQVGSLWGLRAREGKARDAHSPRLALSGKSANAPLHTPSKGVTRPTHVARSMGSLHT
jgi:hypothetical protein